MKQFTKHKTLTIKHGCQLKKITRKITNNLENWKGMKM